MPVLDYLFDNDWIQRADIETLRARSQGMASQMRRNATDTEQRLQGLEDQLTHLAIVQEAVLRALDKKGVVTRDEYRSYLVEAEETAALLHAPPPTAPSPPRPASGSTVRCRSCLTQNDETHRFCVRCRRPLPKR